MTEEKPLDIDFLLNADFFLYSQLNYKTPVIGHWITINGIRVHKLDEYFSPAWEI
jgi:hypothetical protein